MYDQLPLMPGFSLAGLSSMLVLFCAPSQVENKKGLIRLPRTDLVPLVLLFGFCVGYTRY